MKIAGDERDGTLFATQQLRRKLRVLVRRPRLVFELDDVAVDARRRQKGFHGAGRWRHAAAATAYQNALIAASLSFADGEYTAPVGALAEHIFHGRTGQDRRADG